MSSHVAWAPRDRAEALVLLQKGFAALQSAVMLAAGWRADPYVPPAGPIWNWWQLAGIPIVEQWQQFYAKQDSSWSRFWTDWKTYEDWNAQLLQLRDAAKTWGIHV